ncbi:MAG: AmmeMemoRadiSam system protein B, partial [Alphaproteobacteria bacterium]
MATPGLSRPPAVAGMFYPGAAGELARMVDGLLETARAEIPGSTPVPKAIIAPHAGYVYSGATAARAHAR